MIYKVIYFKSHKSVKMQVALWFVFSAYCLIMFYICTKFYENISKGLRVFVRAGFPL